LCRGLAQGRFIFVVLEIDTMAMKNHWVSFFKFNGLWMMVL
jgi:hypothetical protein